MFCAQCKARVTGDWIEWRERHLLHFGDSGYAEKTVTAAILCPPPRVCAAEFAEARCAVVQAQALNEYGDEPF